MTLKEITEKYPEGKYKNPNFLRIAHISVYNGEFFYDTGGAYKITRSDITRDDWELFEEPKKDTKISWQCSQCFNKTISSVSYVCDDCYYENRKLKEENNKLKKSQLVWKKWPEEKPPRYGDFYLATIEASIPRVLCFAHDESWITEAGKILRIDELYFAEIPEVENGRAPTTV